MHAIHPDELQKFVQLNVYFSIFLLMRVLQLQQAGFKTSAGFCLYNIHNIQVQSRPGSLLPSYYTD